MKLWILEAVLTCGYDEYDSFVIRAETEESARRIAGNAAADEGKKTWLKEKFSTCVELETTGEIDIILGSFNAG